MYEVPDRCIRWGGVFLLCASLALAAGLAVPATAVAVMTPIVSGTVTDAISGEPVAFDAFIVASKYNPVDEWYEWAGETYSNEFGEYTIYDEYASGAGDYEIYAESQGYLGSFGYGTWSGVAPLAVDFALDPVATIASGTVTDASTGDPIAFEAYVSASWYNPVDEWYEWASDTWTDEFGSYQLPDYYLYGAGDYEIYAEAGGYRFDFAYDVWDGSTPLAIDFSLSRAETIASGTVTDSGTGDPLMDAYVSASWYNAVDDWYEWAGDDWTDEFGAYVLTDNTGYGAGDYELVVDSYGHQPSYVYDAWDGSTPLAIDFALDPLATIATGVVTAASTGDPIMDAYVSASWYNTTEGWYEWAGDASTDPSGEYTLMDQALYGSGDYEVYADTTGYRGVYVYDSWDGSTPLFLDFALEAAAPIASGKVTDASTADPIWDAYVSASRYNATEGYYEWCAETWTDEFGEYTLYDEGGYGAGDYQILADSDGYAAQRVNQDWDGATPFVADFALDAARPIATGTVTDASSGDPLWEAYVSASWYNAAEDYYEWTAETWTDEFGQYTLTDEGGFGAGDYEVFAEADGYQPTATVEAWDGSALLTVDLALDAVTPPAADAYEPDDTNEFAREIVINGVPQSHTFSPLGDDDWVTFNAVFGNTYVIETADEGSWPTDTWLYLYGLDGATPIADNDDADSLYSRIEWTADYTGAAFVKVQEFSDSEYGAYLLSVTSADLNSPPVAQDDAYETEQDTALVVDAPGVLDNDTDADGDPITATKLTSPANGQVTFNANGAFTYVPDDGFVGTDSFTYKVTDAEASSPAATVEIVVVEDLDPVIPVAGTDRFETAVKTSQEAFPDGAETVVIATGRNWPDALGGTGLAGALDGPVLLVDTTAVPSVVADEIERLGATDAVILGGKVAVGQAVEDALKADLGAANVERIAGANRYETADLVAERTIGVLGDAYDGTAFVATGGNFPDALAAAPLASAHGWPLFLAHPTNGLSDDTKWTMGPDGMGPVYNVLILGGKTVVSQSTEDYLSDTFGAANVERLAGTDRYKTAVAVATYAVDEAGHTWDRVGITTGLKFPDALAGGVLQGKMNSVMVLTKPDSLNADVAAALTANKDEIDVVTFFGGLNAVTQTVRDAVDTALQ